MGTLGAGLYGRRATSTPSFSPVKHRQGRIGLGNL
jgi:hypothetical protein